MATLLMAARQPLAIAVVVVAILTGLLIVPWMLPLGIIVYILVVFIASRDETLRTAQAEQRKLATLTSQTFLGKINRIKHAQDDVENALGHVKGHLAQRLGERVLPQTEALIARAYTLAQKGQTIEEYLNQVNYHQLQRRINEVDNQIDRTTDSYTIDQLQGTRKALVEQLNSAKALETYIGRINSQLDNIDANLNTIPAQIMHMSTSDVDATMASSQVAQHLSDVTADMDAFVGMLDTALSQTRAGA